MPTDLRIKQAFETADDAMQGAIGYFAYGMACHRTAPKQDLLSALPDTLPITHDWVRHYSRELLYDDMQAFFNLYHARVALIAVIAAFEGAIANIREHFGEGSAKAKKNLVWAFEQALQSTYCAPDGPARIPMLCSHVDQARRLRNLWMHKNGLVDSAYDTDAIEVPRLALQRDAGPNCVRKLALPDGRVVAILMPFGFDQFAKSHIELLHHLHDTIQRVKFNQTESYHYGQANKGNDWSALLLGASGLRIHVSTPAEHPLVALLRREFSRWAANDAGSWSSRLRSGHRLIRKLAREARLLSSQPSDAVPFNEVGVAQTSLGARLSFG